ncbi:hypothetical protein, partial [uncultured Rikenella sp.]|uniref:hypothetical protein n=1 Tax=uncultured Rikenella sp. TaxID=368003 RepID=UPI002614BB0F
LKKKNQKDFRQMLRILKLSTALISVRAWAPILSRSAAHLDRQSPSACHGPKQRILPLPKRHFIKYPYIWYS